MFESVLFIIMVGVLFCAGANLVNFISDTVHDIIEHRHQRLMMKKITLFVMALKDANVCNRKQKVELKHNSNKK